jgi:hypothetical protein
MSSNLRDLVIGTAIRAGKFPETRRAFYERMWEADATETAAMIARLTPAHDPLRATSVDRPAPAPPGGGAPVAANDANGYEPAWLTDAERRALDAASQGAPPPRVVHET